MYFIPTNNVYSKFTCQLKKHFSFIQYRSFLKQEFISFISSGFYTDSENDLVKKRLATKTKLSPTGWIPSYEFLILKDPKQFQNESLPIKENRFQFSAEYVTPLIKYCKNKKLNLVFIILPQATMPAKKYYYAKDYNFSSFKKSIALLAKKNSLMLYDLSNKNKNTFDYHDAFHLNTSGAVNISEAIADIIKIELQEKQP